MSYNNNRPLYDDDEDSHSDSKMQPSMSINRNSDWDDEDDGTTRRVGGGGAGIAFAPAIQSGMSGPSFGGPMMSIAPTKTLASAPMAGISMPPASKPGVWGLKSVPTLPEFHPLERTAVFVSYSDAPEVAERISNVLRDRSIEATYDDEKAKVKCMTAEGVDFRIRLYRGRNSYAHGIIVEVQRRFGTSVSFHQDTMAILEAAEGKVPPPPFGFGGSSIPMVSDSEDEYEVDGSSSLDMVAKMFGHSGYDSHYLGFQTLMSLTDASKMGSRTAKTVSRELLKDECEVGNKIRSLVISKKDEDTFKLRLMAFTVLANAIKVTKGQIGSSLREELRPVIVEELRQAKSSPRTAQMAAQCVEYLIQGDHDQDELAVVLEEAEKVGAERHAGLKKQAGICLMKINGGMR